MRVVRSGGIGDWALAVCLFVVEVVLYAVGTLVVAIGLSSLTSSCSSHVPPTCNYPEPDLTLPTYWFAGGLITLGSMVWIVFRGRARKPVWWIPAVGSAAVVGVIIVLMVINSYIYR